MNRLSNQTYVYIVKNQTLASNVDLTGYSSFCVCLVTNSAKDGIFGALQLISCFKGPFLTPQHQLVDIILPQLKSMHICKLQSKLLAHMQVELMLSIGVHETCPYPLHMVKNLGKQHGFKIDFNSYLCVRAVINYQKEGD